MSTYISSNANRFYTALEGKYAEVAAIQAGNRIPAVSLAVRQTLESAPRKDKTGSRTFTGSASGGRRRTEFELQTYLTSWMKGSGGPGYGPLFQAALGGQPLTFSGSTISSCDANGKLAFNTPHGLVAGQGICSGGEIRFVAAIVDTETVQLNVPLSVLASSGALAGPTITYLPATELPSATIFDYWSPSTSVQRLLCGAAVDQLQVLVNGDYHEFHFKGVAHDVVDSGSFSAGAGELQAFPAEPALSAFDYSVIPGNMGQAWLGSSPTRFYTLTSASVVVDNSLDTRAREFGTNLPRAISPGRRSITATFDLYSMDDDATTSLYQAARQESPISVMFQLGESEGSLMGVYLKSVIPEVPEFDDNQNRLKWHFRASRAAGTIDDEIMVAFG
jgi:hypothetical protein